MAHQCLAALGAGGYDVDQPGRQTRFQAQFAEPQRGSGASSEGLNTTAFPAASAGATQDRDSQRAIPRGDDSDHAVGLAFDKVDIERPVDRCTGPVRLVDVSGEMAQEPFEQDARCLRRRSAPHSRGH